MSSFCFAFETPSQDKLNLVTWYPCVVFVIFPKVLQFGRTLQNRNSVPFLHYCIKVNYFVEPFYFYGALND